MKVLSNTNVHEHVGPSQQQGHRRDLRPDPGACIPIGLQKRYLANRDAGSERGRKITAKEGRGEKNGKSVLSHARIHYLLSNLDLPGFSPRSRYGSAHSTHCRRNLAVLYTTLQPCSSSCGLLSTTGAWRSERDPVSSLLCGPRPMPSGAPS